MTIYSVDVSFERVSDSFFGFSTIKLVGMKGSKDCSIIFHSAITAYFLRYFDLVIDVKDANDNVYPVNRAALNEFMENNKINIDLSHSISEGALSKAFHKVLRKHNLCKFREALRDSNTSIEKLIKYVKNCDDRALTKCFGMGYPLHVAISKLSASDLLKLIPFFPEAAFQKENFIKQAPLKLLLFSELKGSESEIKALFKIFIDYTCVPSHVHIDCNKDSYLHRAVKILSDANLKNFLELYPIPPVPEKNIIMCNALHLLVKRNNVDVNLLAHFPLEYYQGVDALLYTPLETALAEGKDFNLIFEMIKKVDHDNLRIQGTDGKNPLHYIAEKMPREFIQYVLPYFPADTCLVQNYNGDTPTSLVFEKALREQEFSTLRIMISKSSVFFKSDSKELTSLQVIEREVAANILKLEDPGIAGIDFVLSMMGSLDKKHMKALCSHAIRYYHLEALETLKKALCVGEDDIFEMTPEWLIEIDYEDMVRASEYFLKVLNENQVTQKSIEKRQEVITFLKDINNLTVVKSDGEYCIDKDEYEGEYYDSLLHLLMNELSEDGNKRNRVRLSSLIHSLLQAGADVYRDRKLELNSDRDPFNWTPLDWIMASEERKAVFVPSIKHLHDSFSHFEKSLAADSINFELCRKQVVMEYLSRKKLRKHTPDSRVHLDCV